MANTKISDLPASAALTGTEKFPLALGGANYAATAIQLDTFNYKGADIASASTTNLAASTGYFVNITGTTTINALGTLTAGMRRLVRFTGVLTLTHNAISLINITSADIITAAGDVAEFESLGSGNWRMLRYQRFSGTSVTFCGFKATKGGTNQTGIAPDTVTPVTFSTETYDIGNVFASSQFVAPRAGVVTFTAQITVSANVVDGALMQVLLYKNGAAFAKLYNGFANTTGTQTFGGTTSDLAAAGDYYSVQVYISGTGNKTISGATDDTWFVGAMS